MKLALATKDLRQRSTHQLPDTTLRDALALHLAGADQTPRLSRAVLDDGFSEQHEAGLENHAEQPNERRSHQAEFNGRYASIRAAKPPQQGNEPCRHDRLRE